MSEKIETRSNDDKIGYQPTRMSYLATRGTVECDELSIPATKTIDKVREIIIIIMNGTMWAAAEKTEDTNRATTTSASLLQ